MRRFVLAVGLVLMAGGAQAATLNVVGGILHGASGVLVDGSLYDVQFLDGTCIDLYAGCVDASGFTFQTPEAALLASQALLDQVFLDGPAGNFESSPALTNGCSVDPLGGPARCVSGTPFNHSGLPEGNVDLITFSGAGNEVDESLETIYTYVKYVDDDIAGTC